MHAHAHAHCRASLPRAQPPHIGDTFAVMQGFPEMNGRTPLPTRGIWGIQLVCNFFVTIAPHMVYSL